MRRSAEGREETDQGRTGSTQNGLLAGRISIKVILGGVDRAGWDGGWPGRSRGEGVIRCSEWDRV